MKYLLIVVFIVLLGSCVQVVVEPASEVKEKRPGFENKQPCADTYKKLVIPKPPIIPTVCEQDRDCVEKILVDYINLLKTAVKEYNEEQATLRKSCNNSLR